MRPIWNLSLTVMLILLAGHAFAAGRRMRSAEAPQGFAPQQGYVQPHGYPSRYNQEMYWRSWYPKYQGGFNSRALQNIGVPSGDIGIRGSGGYGPGYTNPW
jgi:hypothetical protein